MGYMTEVIEREIYECPICNNRYDTKPEAEACLAIGVDERLRVGDIVEVKFGYGWYDGQKDWVINPEIDPNKTHGFGRKVSWGFYYVVTDVEISGHRVRYSVATKAMTGENGHRGGWTGKNHYMPKKVDAPQSVIDESRELIGNKYTNLL